jgi:hypothetical protein
MSGWQTHAMFSGETAARNSILGSGAGRLKGFEPKILVRLSNREKELHGCGKERLSMG